MKITNEALWKIAELMAYAMFINLFLTAAEMFKEFYSNSEHFIHTQYLYFGIGENKTLVPYIWLSIIFNLAAFIIFLVPKTRQNFITLNIGAFLIFFGVYVEKGIGLIIPGFTPDTLGEIYSYFPSMTEVLITIGIFSVGFLMYTLLIKVAVPIILGEFNYKSPINKDKSTIDKSNINN
jgi:molybdopterin-containing oxidoreductase family membrane subunit